MSESKAQKQPVSGKGKLTQEKMLKIQNYYTRCVRNKTQNPNESLHNNLLPKNDFWS